MRIPARAENLREIGFDDIALEPALLVARLQIETQRFRAFAARLEAGFEHAAHTGPTQGLLHPQCRQNCAAFLHV